MQQYASGIDYRELELERDLKSISEETTFAEDVYKREQVLIVLQGLSEGVGYRLRGEGFTARTITLKLRFGDFRTITRSRTLPGPVNNDSDIYRTIRDLFIRHCGRPPWRLVGVKASGFERGTQISLLIPTDAEKKERILLQVKDSLRDKYDAHVLYQAKRLSNKEPGTNEIPGCYKGKDSIGNSGPPWGSLLPGRDQSCTCSDSYDPYKLW